MNDQNGIVAEPLSDDTPDVTATRLRLLEAGYDPLPLYGKEPPIRNKEYKNNDHAGLGSWQMLGGIPDDLVKRWGKIWPDSINTGILTRKVPTLDADILKKDAAEAVEKLVRERFKGKGLLLRRIGLPPKRAFPFRTDVPFKKITINLTAADGSEGQKLEFLCDGQQVVVDGIHPDTGKPYEWFGGQPGLIKREKLPDITEQQAQELMQRAAEMLVADFGYTRVVERNGADATYSGSSDWQYLVDRILAGDALHDSTRDLAAKMVMSGMHPGAAINLLRAVMNSSNAARDQRWQDRYEGIPKLVNSWVRKAQFMAATAIAGAANPNEDDIQRLNRKHAILPIGGKTRVVTFGEMEDFPGRETIVMTQTIDDFVSLNNKYRHEYQDKDGVLQSIPMGKHWINSTDRRQYDGGMAFMPWVDGDVGNKMNLWHGFGVKPIKGECRRFLDFSCDIICSGDETNFNYLIKREAFILQKRTRSEICLGLQTEEEGVGKGFYEMVFRRLLGNHAMMINKPDHLIGKHNPHLETLLRLTADETLFVHNPEHRNVLFNLITEPTLTVEPKFCGVYEALNHMNISDLSNAVHYLPVSKTARRFFIPTVSTARMQDFTYFEQLKIELNHGGYEALLYYLLNEVDLTGFNVRAVPQTEGLRRQRNLSLPPLEAWWCELLETGTLWGADPKEPNKAVSNTHQRMIRVTVTNSSGGSSQQVRQINQPGLYDQARHLEPRIKKNWINDNVLADHLKKMGCKNNEKVLRRRGWTFPPLQEAREKWVSHYPKWEWRNPDLTVWQADGTVEVTDAGTGQAVGVAEDGEDIPF